MSDLSGSGNAALRITGALPDICAALARDLDVSTSAEAIVDLVTRHAGATLACLHHIIPDGPGALQLVACRGASPELEGSLRWLPADGASLIARSARSRAFEAVSRSDPGAAELSDARALFAQGRGSRLVSVALVFCDRPVAVLTCGLDDAALGGEEETALRALVGILALAHGRAVDSEALRRAKESLEISEERLNRTIEESPIGMALVALDGRFIRVNRVLCELLGYSPEELIRLRFQDITHPEDLDADLAQAARLLEGDIDRYQLEKRYVRKDGSIVEAALSGSIVRDRSGSPIHFIAQIEDVTERKRAAEALAAEQRWLRTVIERSPVGIVLSHDPKGTRITANRRAEELFGEPLSPEGGITQYLARFCTPDGVTLDVDDLPTRRALRGETTTGRELLLRRHDGSGVPVLVSAGPIFEDRGQLLGAVVVYEDLTRIKDLERLREEWTSMVAHELRQPVTTILGYAALLARRIEAPDRARADHILASAQRLNRMIGDLLDASSIEARRLAITRRPTDLGALLRSVAERCAAEARGHPVEVEMHGAPPSVDVDAGRIEQVLTNLISNAAKYGYPDTEVRVLLERRAREVEIAVENHGPGIDPEDLRRLFARFQRGSAARTQIVGVGLGLYIARGLVEAHGGRLWAESTPGERTIFRFTLPLAGEAAAHTGATA